MNPGPASRGAPGMNNNNGYINHNGLSGMNGLAQTGPMATVQMGGLNLDKMGAVNMQNSMMGQVGNGGGGAGGPMRAHANTANNTYYTNQRQTAGGPMTNMPQNFARQSAAPYSYGNPAQMNQVNQLPVQAQVYPNYTAPAGISQPVMSTPVAQTAPAPISATPVTQQPEKCPFPYVVSGAGFPTGVTNPNIQEFFRPFKAIAVKLETDGSGDIAFKSHDEAVGAMSKTGQLLLGVPIHLTLKSKPDEAIQRGGGWSTSIAV